MRKPFYSGRNQAVYAEERAEAGGIQVNLARAQCEVTGDFEY